MPATNEELPSAAQLTALRAAYKPFREQGRWPVAAFVRRQLRRHGLDFEVIMTEMPPHWVRLPAPTRGFLPGDEIRLTAAGISQLPEAADDVSALLSLLRLLADLDANHDVTDPYEVRTGLQVHSEDLLQRLGLSSTPILAQLLYDLIRLETGVFGSSGTSPEGDWTAEVSDQAYLYEDVEDVYDLARIRRGQELKMPATTSLAPEPSVFIVMPFGEPWSDATHALMEEALLRVRDVRPIRWIRADEIAEPGRITDQIVRGIIEASVVLADITGNNPNVLFELGYADALGKPIVCLNQEVNLSPFDIRDWRQIAYTQDALVVAKNHLVRYLLASLPVPAVGVSEHD